MDSYFFFFLGCLLMITNTLAVSSTGCNCIKSNYDCGCCADLKISKIGLDDNVCVNASYLPREYGISLTFSIDGKVFINETVSARNPPPICVDVPHLRKLASICIDFNNLDISNKTFSGCIDLEARLAHIFVEKVHLGCFHVGDSVQNWMTIGPEPIEKGRQQLKEMERNRLKKISEMAGKVVNFN